MTQRLTFTSTLAFAIALALLAGCASPTSGPMGALAGSSAVNAQADQSAADAMADEQDMNDYTALAIDSYGTLSMRPSEEPSPADGASPKPSDPATLLKHGGSAPNTFPGDVPADVQAKVEQHWASAKQNSLTRLANRSAEKSAVEQAANNSKWVDNGDGTETKTISFGVTRALAGKSAGRQVTITITRTKASRTIVSHTADFDTTLPNGQTRKSHRAKTLNANASWHVLYHFQLTHKDGASRTVDEDKLIGADGGVTGTGTLTLTDAGGKVIKSVSLTFGGKDGEEQATTKDEQSGATGSVKPADDDQEASETESSPAPSASPAAGPDAGAGPNAHANARATEHT